MQLEEIYHIYVRGVHFETAIDKTGLEILASTAERIWWDVEIRIKMVSSEEIAQIQTTKYLNSLLCQP